MTKYTVKITKQFKKDYKLAIKRGLKIDLLEQIVASLADGVLCPIKTTTMPLQGIGWGIVNATSCPIDCLSIALRAMSSS